MTATLTSELRRTTRTLAQSLAAIAAFGVAGLELAAGEATVPATVPPAESIQVMDMVIVSTNEVMLGTNTMSLADATNAIARHRDRLELIAIHESIKGDSAGRTAVSPSVAAIARAGVPLVFVEKDGEYAWREHSGAHGVRTVTIGTDQFAELRRLLKIGKDPEKAATGPVLKSTVDWDAVSGSYEMKRVELGLFGERVWLMHELRESDESPGGFGIQIRKEW